MISKTHKTFRFFWVHIHLIQELSLNELERYCKSVSMAVWPDTVKKIINKAIEERRKELTTTLPAYDLMVVHSNITVSDL